MPNNVVTEAHNADPISTVEPPHNAVLDEHREAVLRISTIYPGHPCLIAMQIMCSFPSYDAANQRTKEGWPEALSCSMVRGAGGAVHQGMELLRLMVEESTLPDEAQSFGCTLWQRSRESDHPNALEQGNIEAQRHRDLFLFLSSAWIAGQHAHQSTGDAPGLTIQSSGMLNPSGQS